MRSRDRRPSARPLAWIAAALLAACEGKPVTDAPPEPPQIATFKEVPFGDAMLHQGTRSLLAVLDQLEPRFGRVAAGKLEVLDRELTAEADLNTVQQYYARELTARHLRPLPLSPAKGSAAFAFADDVHVFAVVSMRRTTDNATTNLPLYIVTNFKRTD